MAEPKEAQALNFDDLGSKGNASTQVGQPEQGQPEAPKQPGALDFSDLGSKGQEQAAPQGQPEEKPSGMEGVSGFEAGATPETGYHPGPLSKGVTGGMGAEALDMVKGLIPSINQIPGVSQLRELPSQYRAYEAARQKGLPPIEAMKVVQQELQKKGNALKSLQERVKELTSADSETSARAIGKSIIDLLPIALGTAMGVEGGAAETEAAATKAVSVPEVEAQAAKTAEQVVTHKYNPATRTVEPIQQAATQGVENVAKRVGGMPEGAAASVAPTEESIQPALESGMHEVSEAAAKDSGVTYTKGADVRDAMGTTARATKASASADYKALDEASEGRWQRFDDKLENIKNEIDEKVGIDDDRVAALETKRDGIIKNQETMLKEMVDAGKVDPNIADRAMSTYKQAMAQHDVTNAIRGATKKGVAGGKSIDVTDPNGLINRLQKLNDVPPSGGPSRLVQALGEKGAKQIMEHAENAQIAKAAVKDFTPTTATGKVALQDILGKHTKPGLGIGAKGKVDWKASLDDFESLEPTERTSMFGKDVSGVRTALTRNARIQTAKAWVLKYGAIAAGLEAGHSILRELIP